MFFIQKFEAFLEVQKKEILLLFLSILLLGLNFFLLPYGSIYHNSDNSIQPLWAERVLIGEWSAFPFQQGYGSTTLSGVRALFLAIGSIFGVLKLDLHFIFSYLVVPLFILWTHFLICLRLFSKKTAFLSSLLLCAYPVAWVATLGMDYYYTLILLGYCFIFLKFQIKNFWDVPLKSSLGLGFLIGFSLYSFRGTFVYILLFFLPLDSLKKRVAFFFLAKTKIERVLLFLMAFLLLLQLRIDFFGYSFGSLFGKPVKLHSSSNLHLICIFLFLYAGIRFRAMITRQGCISVCLGVVGFIVGFLPEILHLLKVQRSAEKNFLISNFEQSLQTLLTLSQSIYELLIGLKSWNLDSGILQNSVLFLFLFSVVWTFFHIIHDFKYRVLGVGVLLSVIAYLKVFLTGIAESRYLFPVFPFYFVLIAKVLEDLSIQNLKKYKHVLLFFYLSLILLSVFFQTSQKWKVIERSQSLSHYGVFSVQEQKVFQKEMTDYFWSHSFKNVITDAHLMVNTFTLMNESKVFYTSVLDPWGPPEARALGLSERELGIVLIHSCPSSNSKVTLLKREFFLEKVKQVGYYCIYRGKALD